MIEGLVIANMLVRQALDNAANFKNITPLILQKSQKIFFCSDIHGFPTHLPWTI
jgi:hypothetical protein